MRLSFMQLCLPDFANASGFHLDTVLGHLFEIIGSKFFQIMISSIKFQMFYIVVLSIVAAWLMGDFCFFAPLSLNNSCYSIFIGPESDHW